MYFNRPQFENESVFRPSVPSD